MAQIQEIRLPERFTVSEIRNILEQLKENKVLRLINNRIDIKVVKIETDIQLYLVFGEHYIIGDDDNGYWKYVMYVVDDIDRLAFFIHSL